MRLALAVGLESRDGGVTKDAKVLNGIVESRGEDIPAVVKKRPGCSDAGLVKAGTAQALTHWNGHVTTVQADYLNVGTNARATWNPNDKNANVILSNGNLTETSNTVPSPYGVVRSTVGVSHGKWYWEITIAGGATVVPGIATAAASTADAQSLGSDAYGWGWEGTVLRHSGTATAYGAQFVAGDVIGIALDLENGRLVFYKNGVSQGVAATGLSGTFYAASSASGATATANFGASAFGYSVPVGHNGGLYSASDFSYSSISSTALNPTDAGLQFAFQDNGSNAPNSQLMLKNASQAWTLSAAGTLTQITDVDYPGTYAVTLTSLTRSGTVATATTANDTNFQVGSTVTIAGATPAGYNGAQTITGVTPSSSVQIGPVAIAITRSGTTATATTITEPHGFTNGQTVTIKGASQSEYNGDHVITWISATSFSFTVTVTSNASATTATGAPAVSTWYDGSGISASNNETGSFATVRIYTPFGNTLANGNTITILGTGTLGAALSGSFAVANRSASSFDITTSLTSSFAASSITITRVPATLTGITRSGTNFTFTFSAAHNINTVNIDKIVISGATEDLFNGLFHVRGVTSTTAVGYYDDSSRNSAIAGDSPATPATGNITAEVNTKVGASFTFTVSGALATPATGTITATSGRTTVPGIAYLDGYFVVMDINGVIYNSAEDDPSIWNALEYLTALAETGAGKAVARSLNYIVAFKEWSTELFWNAGNEPPGSPLGPVDNGLILVGCASGDSVKPIDGKLVWLSQVRERGRSIHIMQGLEAKKISTPDVERILNADDLATVRAIGLKLDGHPLYVLTLETSNITIVYDFQSGQWTQWSSLTLNGSSISVSSITRSGTTATVTTSTAHGLSDGDPVKIAGATQTDYNGIFQAFVVSTTVFTIEVSNSPATPAMGTITATGYTESYFKFTKYADAAGIDVVLHESDGHLYQLSSTVYQDAGIPVNLFIRTSRLDGETTGYKFVSAIRLVGDHGTDQVAVRWSDDDSQTFSIYRNLDMSNDQPETRRCGKFRRRSLEFRHFANTARRIEAAELDIGGQ